MKSINWKRVALYALPLGLLAYASYGVWENLGSLRNRVDSSYALTTRNDEGFRLEMELGTFQSDLIQYVMDEGTVSFDDVMLSFDLVWSRTQVLNDGSIYTAPRGQFEGGALLLDLQKELHSLDALLIDLKPGEIKKMNTIIRSVSSYRDRMVSVVNKMIQQRVDESNELRLALQHVVEGLDRMHTEFGLGVFLFVLLLTIETVKARRAESKLKHREKRVRYLAEHDTLTGLGNRAYFNKSLGRMIDEAAQDEESVQLLMMDLDGFKDVNDSFGHPVGDELLKIVATRLNRCIRDGDELARLGGDEFGIIIGSPASAAQMMSKRIVESLAKPFSIDNKEIRISTSIGVASYPENAKTPAALMRDSDMALYDAKASGRNSYRFYKQSMKDALDKRKGLEVLLREALDKNQLEVHYQPQICLKTGQVLGVEALARWTHPERGFIPPSDFIPVAEHAGLIPQLGEWVFRQSCIDVVEWHNAGHHIRMSVNLSPLQLATANLADEILAILQETSARSEFITLELTETSMMKNTRQTKDTLTRLNKAGIRFAVDDFGTGYSNLGYLLHYPVSYLKIDRSFIMNIEDSNEEQVMTRGIINLAHGLGLSVVAEGIETLEQSEILQEMQCQEGQGYFYGKPMSKLKILLYLEKMKSNVTLLSTGSRDVMKSA